MKEKLYIGHTLTEVEDLAVKELGVPKEDMYFDEMIKSLTLANLNYMDAILEEIDNIDEKSA